MSLGDLVRQTDEIKKPKVLLTNDTQERENPYGSKRIMCFMRWGIADDWTYNIIDINELAPNRHERIRGLVLTDEELTDIGAILLRASKRVEEN